MQASLSSDAGKRIAEVFDYQGVSAGTRTGVVSTGEAYVCTPVPQAYTSVSKVFKSTSEYQYLIDGIALSDLKLNFTAGTMHGTALAGKQQSLSNATVLQKNGSYLVNITFKKKAPFCLFNDGTIGYAGDKTATRVPIALVVKEKSTESAKDGMAIALHNAGSGRYPLTTLSLPNINTEAYAWNRLQDFLNDERGYYWTYDKAASVQPNTVKAERETDYPAFYQAAHYTPNVSVPINGIGKWYLPAAGEWKLFIEKLGQTTVSASGGAGIGIGANPTPNLTQMAAWFTEAGGEIDVNWSQWYLISTEYETSTMIAAVPYGMYNNFPQRDGWFMRPFVHF